jgi:hypothetical protein
MNKTIFQCGLRGSCVRQNADGCSIRPHAGECSYIGRIRRRNISARSGTVYVAVLGVALIVSAIAFSAMAIARVQLRAARDGNHLDEARLLAHAAIEHCATELDANPSWRSTYVNGQENFQTPLGGGTLSWKLWDDDLDLQDDVQETVQILGIGRVGGATWVSGVTYEPSRDAGPSELRSYSGAGAAAQADVHLDQWGGQYFVPTLPAETTEWQVTSIQIVARQSGAASETLLVRLYMPDGQNKPGTLVESVSVAEALLPAAFGWHTVNFTTNSGLDPSVGLCLTLETTDASPAAQISYENSGVAEADSHLIYGGNATGWTSTFTDRALHYKIQGTYQVKGHLVPGTWTREPSP